MKTMISAGLLSLTLVSCATQKPQVASGREPNQYRGDERRDDRRGEDRRDNDRRDYDRRNNDRRDDRRGDDRRVDSRRPDDRQRGGHQDWRMRGDRRCIRCFDNARFSDTVKLGREVTLLRDQSWGSAGTYDEYIIPAACGIRSVSIEVLDNEAQITSVEVHYQGDSYSNWDRLPLQKNWDFRNGSQEGDTSSWFDVGSSRRDDRVCIDRVRVSGFTYKDFYDFDYAKVQFYGSRSLRGVSDRPGPGPGDYRPTPGPGPGPGSVPMPGTPIFETKPPFIVAPAFDCIRDLPNVTHADQMHSDSLFGSGKALGKCSNARRDNERRLLEARGYACTKTEGRLYPDCYDNIMSKIIPETSKGKPSGTHKAIFKSYCSDEIWSCSKQIGF